jgi:hypothetical protein
MSKSTKTNVSSPAATGGAGNSFEQHVVAYWLALLLVRAVPPILRDCTMAEVHFQVEHLDRETDDFLLVGQTGSGQQRRLLGQVKRSFTVSGSDEECVKAIGDFWKDFKNTGLFNPDFDRFALITLRGTNVLLEHFAGLLDCARSASNAADFEHRLNTKGFVDAKVVAYCNVVQTIVGNIEHRAMTVQDVWAFLKSLHILSLDLATATAQAEALVKTLLAHTCGEADALGAANTTWFELLREATDGQIYAKSYTRDTLPESVRRRHSPVATADHYALRALVNHSVPILDGIRSTVGPEVHLARSRLVQTTLNCLESSQVVLLTGLPGTGKSSVAKNAFSILATDYFAFCFRAEEFAQPHLDQSLLQAQVPIRASALSAVLAGQSRKVILVESLERLLEASTRDAFSDLLNLIRNDKSWRLLLTCRDYSADLVRTSFLDAAGVSVAIVPIPQLDDEELNEVEKAVPMIRNPLASSPLRALMRNPYILDMAFRAPWPEEQSLPSNEREFRNRIWQTVVRVDQRSGNGLPQRREQTFVEVALRRARALSLHAQCDDLDGEAVHALRSDSLVVSPKQSLSLAAPAHDVLEDWAILWWIQQQYGIHASSVTDFANSLGTHPAIRRTYRKWVGELVEVDATAADELFKVATTNSSLAAQFKDDSLVAILRSPAAPSFLNRHRDGLFRDEKAILRRVIHLLRVGCVKTPEWLGTTSAVASVFAIPDGPSWACVLQLVHDNLGLFGETDRLLLLGLIEDWARGVSWQTPYPAGAESAVAIAYHILSLFNSFKRGEERKRTLKVIAKVPNCDRQRFQSLLEGQVEEESDDE